MPQPPVAARRPHPIEKHGHTRIDDYFWMRERDDPEVIAYLEAENRYTEEVMAVTAATQERLFAEFKNRIRQTDLTVPYRHGPYYYYSRVEAGRDYRIYCRKRGGLDAEEEILLDVNELAEGKDFYQIAGWTVSPNHCRLAFGEDVDGRRVYQVRVLDLKTKRFLPDEIPGVTSCMEWANDNQTLFYVELDPETLRWNRIRRHRLGSDVATDPIVFEETDPTFYTSLFRSRSDRYLLIESWQTVSTEVRILDADRPASEPVVFFARERDHEYSVDHFGDEFLIRTNWDAPNFRLMRTADPSAGRDAWEDLYRPPAELYVEGFESFRDHLVILERDRGLTRIRIRRWGDGEEHSIDFGEPTYSVGLSHNHEADTTVLRFEYSSFTTPDSVYDYDMATRERTLLKQEEVGGGFDSRQYRAERVFAPARDGTEIPISLVYRTDRKRAGGNPLLLYGYGSYGISQRAGFSPYRISLLDRGFVYAIAHIRGGQELGRRWYESGKLLAKKNTFTDFIDSARFLEKTGLADGERMYAMGGSAGGLLIGAVINEAPEVFHGVAALVPFVDVVTTMLDDTIPLTTSEYDEWGNPANRTYYDYMLSYSPYDRVEPKTYPNMLVISSYQDSQVQYWEPTKWVAKLRALGHGPGQLLLKTQMDASHSGTSGRDSQYRETAFLYAFFLQLAGVE